MGTTNEKSFWYTNVADDHNGHQGVGSTPENAQKALEIAQAENIPSAEHASLTGAITRNDFKL